MSMPTPSSLRASTSYESHVAVEPPGERRGAASPPLRPAASPAFQPPPAYASAAQGCVPPPITSATATVTPPTSVTVAEEKLLDEGLTASAQQASAVIERRPTLQSAMSMQLFPDARPPRDLSQVYVSEYTEYDVADSGDNGGTITLGVRRQQRFRSVADLLSDAFKTGGTPDFLKGNRKYGLFGSPGSVTQDNALPGITMDQFKERLDALVKDPAAALKRSTAAYFQAPSSTGGGSSPQAELRLYRGAQLRAEVELRSADGSLAPKDKAMIDKLLADPGQTKPDTPLVFRVAVGMDGVPSPGLAVPGAVWITDRRAALDNLQGGVLYAPELGLQSADSLQGLQRHFAAKTHREPLLDLLSDSDYAKLPARHDNFRLSLTPLSGDALDYSLQSQLRRQDDDVTYAFQQARTAGITEPDQLDVIERHVSEPLKASFDANRVQARRMVEWVEANRPAWWKNASYVDQVELDRWERQAKSTSERLHKLMQERVPSLHDYAVLRIKNYLRSKYPGADIDPDAIQVLSAASDRTRAPAPTKCLTQFIIDNVKSKLDLIAHPQLNPHWHASFKDRKGKEITLRQDDLRTMARDLNVGQGYQDMFIWRMISPLGRELRQAWKDSYVAAMRADAKQAQLSGELSASDYQRVEALLNEPGAVPPRANGENLQLNYLSIGGVRTGASVQQVLSIAKQLAGPNDPMILYTPSAPGDRNMRSYSQGMRDLNADRTVRGEDWQNYFLKHVSANQKPHVQRQFVRGYSPFERSQVQGGSFRDMQDTMYEAHVRQLSATAQTQAKSNHQLNKETWADLALFIMDVTTTAADFVIPGRAALKSLTRLLNPRNAVRSLKDLPNFAAIVQKGARRPLPSLDPTMLPKRASADPLHDLARANRMQVVDFHGRGYLAQKAPDLPDGSYLLRIADPRDRNKLISSGLIVKPETVNGVKVWQRRGVKGGGVASSTARPGDQATPSTSRPTDQVTPSTSRPSDRATPSTSGPSDQAALINDYNAAKTLQEKQVAFKKLYKDFFDNVPPSTYPSRPAIPALGPNATTTDLINAAYRNARGLVLGETHTNVSAIKFLYDNLINLKRNGVNTLYVEGFNGRWLNMAATKKERLNIDYTWDRKKYGWPYRMSDLYERAENQGIRVIGVDNRNYTRYTDTTDRLMAMNYWAKMKILQDQVKHPGNWLAFVGQGHMKTSGKKPVPGLVEILGAIGVEIHPAPKGVASSVSTPPQAGWAADLVQNGDLRIDLNIDDVAKGNRPETV